MSTKPDSAVTYYTAKSEFLHALKWAYVTPATALLRYSAEFSPKTDASLRGTCSIDKMEQAQLFGHKNAAMAGYFTGKFLRWVTLPISSMVGFSYAEASVKQMTERETAMKNFRNNDRWSETRKEQIFANTGNGIQFMESMSRLAGFAAFYCLANLGMNALSSSDAPDAPSREAPKQEIPAGVSQDGLTAQNKVPAKTVVLKL